jgi:hypothetical protein
VRRVRSWCIAAAALVIAAAGARAEEDEAGRLRRELDELRRTVESQHRRIEELERGQLERHGDLEEAVARYLDELPDDRRKDYGIALRTRRGAMLDLYGFVRIDVIRDDSEPQDPMLIGWVRSEDPDAPSPVGAEKDSADLTFDARLTRLGLDLHGGRSGALGADVTGKIEVDFLSGSSNSRGQVRMRHAYVKLTWDEWSVLAGQTFDVAAPLYAAVNNALAMWGAGNLGDRRPQVRVEYAPKYDDVTLFFQGMAGVTGADAQEDLDADGILDGESSGRPTLQGRVAVRKPMLGRRFELGLWGHLATEDPNSDVPDVFGEDDFKSRLVGFDLTLPLVDDWLWLKTEWWDGTNLDDVRGGIFQGVNPVSGEEIESRGGWIELCLHTTDWMTLHFGYAKDDPADSDLRGGGVIGGRAKNATWYIATRLTFDDVKIGLEYLDWTTKYVGYDKGRNQRVAAFVAYCF